MCQIDVKAER